MSKIINQCQKTGVTMTQLHDSTSSWDQCLRHMSLFVDWDYRHNLYWSSVEVAANTIIGSTFTTIGVDVLCVHLWFNLIQLDSTWCDSTWFNLMGPPHKPFSCGWWCSVQRECVPSISVISCMINKCSHLSISGLECKLMKSNDPLGSSQLS